MPEHLRALSVIVVLAATVFLVAEKSCRTFVSPKDFKRWRNIWFASTIAAFLSMSFWLYALAASLLLFICSVQYKNRAALFLLLLFVIPSASVQIPGFGLINHLFQINQSRLLAILLLLPSFLSAGRSASSSGKFSDGLLLTYVLFEAALQLRQTTITDTARYSFYIFLDTVLPYYVFSRSLKDIQAFRHVLLCFVLACMVISLIAMFEFGKRWLLYSAVTSALGLGYEHGYLGRADMLRASGPTGHPIILGYVLMVAIGFYLFLMKGIDNAMRRRMGLALLIGGLIAALSRGPWIGTVVLIGVFVSTGRTPVRHLIGFGLAGVLGLATLIIVPGGEKILDLLPYFGSVDVQNIEYRERLLGNAFMAIQRNLWFGSVDYLQTPEMQEMIQGQGIIDVVNTYLGVALQYGLVGLSLFVLFFVSTLFGLARAFMALPESEIELKTLARALFATLCGVLVTIFTVSSIGQIPCIYWILAGLCVAQTRIISAHMEASRVLAKAAPSVQRPAKRRRLTKDLHV